MSNVPLPEEVDVDLRMLFESVFSGKTEMNYSYSVSPDFKKMIFKSEIFSDSPIVISDEFSLSTYAKTGMWMEYDFSDTNKPVYKILFKLPFYKKYVGMDLSQYFIKNPEQIPVIDKDSITDAYKQISDNLVSNSKIVKKGSEITITLDDIAAKKYILDIFKVSEFLALSSVTDERVKEEYRNVVKGIEDVFSKITLLGKDGLTLKYKSNSLGFITEYISKTHICINIYDLLEAFSMSTEGLDREIAFFDVTAITEQTVAKHNKVKDLKLPELTENNSDIAVYPDNGYQSLISDSEQRFNVYDKPVFENDNIYYPMNSIVKYLDFNITDVSDVLTVNTKTTIGTIGFDFNKGTIFINDEKAEAPAVPAPVIRKNDNIYVAPEFLELLNVSVYISEYDYKTNKCTMNVHFYVPDVVTEPETNKSAEAYVPATLRYNIYFNVLPVVENGEVYFPVYDLLEKIMPGEYTFTENSITKRSTETGDLGYTEFSALTNDNYITVNGEKMDISSPVINTGGIIQIPLSAIENLGFTTELSTNYTNNGYTTQLRLGISNPKYIKTMFDENTYVSEHFYFYVNSDKPPYIENDVVYMPVYEFLQELYDGEFKFDTDYMEYTANGKGSNPLGISKVSVRVGDSFVTVDEKQIPIAAPIINVNDVIRMPMTFAETLGMEITNVSISGFGGASYNMVADNPEYVPQGFEKLTYNNWFFNLFENIF